MNRRDDCMLCMGLSVCQGRCTATRDGRGSLRSNVHIKHNKTHKPSGSLDLPSRISAFHVTYAPLTCRASPRLFL